MAYWIWLAMSMSGLLIGLDLMIKARRRIQPAQTQDRKKLSVGAHGEMILSTFDHLSAHQIMPTAGRISSASAVRVSSVSPVPHKPIRNEGINSPHNSTAELNQII